MARARASPAPTARPSLRKSPRTAQALSGEHLPVTAGWPSAVCLSSASHPANLSLATGAGVARMPLAAVAALSEHHHHKPSLKTMKITSKSYSITTQAQLRGAFWEDHPQFAGDYRSKKRQNDYSCDIRTAFVDYVDHLAWSDTISEKLAARVTL